MKLVDKGELFMLKVERYALLELLLFNAMGFVVTEVLVEGNYIPATPQ